MKTVWIVLGSVALAVVLIVAGLWIGSAWAQGGSGGNRIGYGPMGSGMMGYGPAGSGMMGGSWDGLACGAPGVSSGVQQGMPCGGGYTTPGQGKVTSLDEATAAIERYVQSQGYTGLAVHEVMEFERNYYAIVSEKDTGIGAMELLVDKGTGAVGPEPGPNMMWNAKYGMMGQGGMMGRRGMMAGVATTRDDPVGRGSRGGGPALARRQPAGPDGRRGRSLLRLLHAALSKGRQDRRHAECPRQHRRRLVP